ncbi:PD-(D/E)XK nuclease family protein [Bergeyella sp. RCAD1439]|uniref:PD-(D/E)XK nuclease family protein n=1 Tax=Bergeyella anatis TaxID=3113737 RepID=UPI002E19F334|nr:PD-(D/E)XK nuclease family protein [Bergeyella sp. RCAD1439]
MKRAPQHSFLENLVSELLSQREDLSDFRIVLPGKRPVIFIKKILSERGYTGFLPDFYTIEELIQSISGRQLIQGVALWLFAYEVYRKQHAEDLSEFLKWFPTLLKDWDDILKFAEKEEEVLDYMFAEERIKNWGEDLGEPSETRRRNLNFWRKMRTFLPELKKQLSEKGLATMGMLHEQVRNVLSDFVEKTEGHYVFCGFNAFTPVEEKMVKTLMQWDKAQCFFQADDYYLSDERQEAGKFLRSYRQWKEFNEHRPFRWISNRFASDKTIKVFEVSGNITQTKVLPLIFEELKTEDLSDTAVVLLDENLLPASLDALRTAEHLNITMGFPLKNMAFSNAVKHLFYIQKQLEKKSGSYYYRDILNVLELLPNNEQEAAIIRHFTEEITEKNIVYLSPEKLQTYLGELSYFDLFKKAASAEAFLETFIRYCTVLKFHPLDDMQYENVLHFETSFRIIKHQIASYDFSVKIETLEVLVQQLIGTETIDFQGEPLKGLQIMGLLETRLLNFRNIIMLSVNEGKLPLGNSQNTYLPFDVRKNHQLHTFLENDSIYAYHFYRLLQEAENIYLLYNALGSGVNTGEKSRFITQIEMESPHAVKTIVIDHSSEPAEEQLMTIAKTPAVMERLEQWKEKVSASHLTAYLYDPIQFYMNHLLKARQNDEIEEELSQRNYGNLVHLALQILYEGLKGRVLNENDLSNALQKVDEAIAEAIVRLNHQPEFYERGMNYIHRSIAHRVVSDILKYDLRLVQKGHRLEILDLEKEMDYTPFIIDEATGETVKFYGFIDRVDRLDGTLRVIDYKTAKPKELHLKFVSRGEDKTLTLLTEEKYKQAIQLCIYLYYLRQAQPYQGHEAQAGIWSFAEVGQGVEPLVFSDGNLDSAMVSIAYLIREILNPKQPFQESPKTPVSP